LDSDTDSRKSDETRVVTPKGGDFLGATNKPHVQQEIASRERRRRSIIAFEMIRLDRASAEPLHQQLYRQIRDELRSGSFIDGASRLPSSRALAADLGISRLTVNLAFSKLHAEGYLRSKAKSGTFVAYPLPESFLSADKFATGRIRGGGAESHPAAESRIRISDRVKAIPDQRAGKQFDLGATGAGAGISLVPSIPAVDEFPIGVWERLRAQVLAKKGAHLLRYASNRGDADLRNALAAYLCDFRAARCDPEQIVIVGGMQQAMLISATALLNPGDPAWVEDPCYQQTRRVLTLADARIIPKPLDDEGIVITRSSKEPFPKLIYITPSHEFPLGVTMSFRAGRPCSISRARITRSSSKTITTPSSVSPGRRSLRCRESITPAG
jgi:GntR family transcriptional regulator/MocR family aminotransferase